VYPWVPLWHLMPMMSSWSRKGPSSLQGERSVSTVPIQRQSAWEVTVIVWHSYGFCLLGEPSAVE
jgi:hypothetical protein